MNAAEPRVVPPSTDSVAPKEPRKRKRHWPVRILAAAVVAILSVFPIYVVAINVFLSTSLFTKIIDYDPETVDIHYQRAWSWFPGRVHGEGVSIRSRDSHIEFILKIEEVDFDISLLPLAHKHFTVTQASGRGVSMRVRPRLDAEPKSPAEYTDLPPIDGEPPYAVATHVPYPGLWDDAKWNLWTISLDHITATDVREVWVGAGRFEGVASVAGRFYLKPVRLANIGPCHIEVDRGDVRVGATPLLTAIAGKVDTTIRSFDARYVLGSDILHYVSATTELRATIPEIQSLGVPLPEGFVVTGAIAFPRLDVHLQDGALVSGTSVRAELPELQLTRGDARVATYLRVEGDVHPDAGHPRLFFRVDAPRLGLAHTAPNAPEIVRAWYTTVTGDSASLDLTHPFDDLHARVEISDLSLPALQTVDGILPPRAPIAFHRGAVHGDGHFEIWLADKRVAGAARLSADDVDVTIEKARARGGVTLDASFARYAWDTEQFTDADVGLSVRHTVISADATPGVVLVAANALDLKAAARTLNLAHPLDGVDLSVTMPEAVVIDSGVVRSYLAVGSVSELSPGNVGFSLTADGRFAAGGGKSTVELAAPHIGFVYRSLGVRCEARARLKAHDLRLDSGDLALDALSLDLTHLSVSPVGGEGGAAPAMTIDHVGVVATSPRVAFADPLARLTVQAQIVAGTVRDSAALSRLLPTDSPLNLESDGASFSATARADIVDHVINGGLEVHASRVGVGGKSVHVRGDVAFAANKVSWSIPRKKMTVDGAAILVVSNVTGRFSGDKDQFSVARVVVNGRAKDLDLESPSLGGLDLELAVEDIVLPNVKDASSLLPTDSVVGIESGNLHASVNLAISSRTKTADGSINVALKDGGVRFQTAHYEGDFVLTGLISGFDPAKSTLNLSGSTLSMRNVLVTHASSATSRWHGDLAFEKGTMHIGEHFAVDSFVSLDARDADPLLAVALGDDIPKFLVGLVNMPRLKATAHLMIGTGRFSLQEMEAEGGDLKLRGVYAVNGKATRGGIAITKGDVSVGIGLDGSGAHLHLFDLDRWLREQKAATLPLIEVAPADAAGRDGTATSS